MRKIITAAALALTLAGCGGAAATRPASPATTSCAAQVRLADPSLTPAQVQALCAVVPTSAPAGSQAANPMPILRETGVPVPAGTAYDQDIYGDRYALGNWPYHGHADGGESVQVYTFADQAAMDADFARNGVVPQDGRAVINGHLFDVTVDAVQSDSGGWIWQVAPAVIAARVHGTLVKP